MLSKFFSTLSTKSEARTKRTILPWVMQGSQQVYQLTRPNWEAIYARVDSEFKDQDQNLVWNDIAFSWLSALNDDLGAEYGISESANFMLLSCETDRYNASLLKYLEQYRRRLMHILQGVCSDDGYGKYLVMVFSDNDRYYDYISYYGPQEGTFGMSSGSFMNHGYGHFVFPHQDLSQAEPVAAHEMTHAMLSHLNIPLWLDEGIAVNMEALLTGHASVPLNRDFYAKHQAFWNSKTIQEFWSGASFYRADDGQTLSYQLARVLVSNLSEDSKLFAEFCNTAQAQDSGERALNTIFDLSLQDMLTNFLGAGDWRPMAMLKDNI